MMEKAQNVQEAQEKKEIQEARVVFAPNPYPTTQRLLFLSGSIDQLPATWQSTVSNALSYLPITILNPHRPDWDSSWKQDITFPPFKEQVSWELDAMEAADVIAVYFSPTTQAPITLLELGLFARSGKCVVGCPEGYWRRGNVQVICDRFGIKLVGSVGELIEETKKRLASRDEATKDALL
jgi:hypothetical protein